MVIKVLDSVSSYEEAIKISCEILEKRGSISCDYYGAILKKIEEYGAYFCIADKIAMPHARSEDGVLKDDVCILKLNTPTYFEGKSINLFFTLSATSSNLHLDIIRKIASICKDKEKVDYILNCKNENEIEEVI